MCSLTLGVELEGIIEIDSSETDGRSKIIDAINNSVVPPRSIAIPRGYSSSNPDCWSVVDDTSIEIGPAPKHKTRQSFELTSPKISDQDYESNEAWKAAIRDVLACLSIAGITPITNETTGSHVHVGLKKKDGAFTLSELKKLAYITIVYEGKGISIHRWPRVSHLSLYRDYR